MNRAFSTAVLAMLVLPAWAGCSSILGLEEARLDSNQAEGGPPPSLCEQYCEAALANCPNLSREEDGADYRIYFSQAECLATCAVLPPGTEGDEQGNTVHCRLLAAQRAKDLEDFETYCPAAGPGGNGICGTNCEGFCTMTLAVCVDRLQTLESEITAETCQTTCEALPDLGGFDITKDLGNSVQCRIYHASAATLDASQHCAHVANKTKVDQVGGPCDPSNDDEAAMR